MHRLGKCVAAFACASTMTVIGFSGTASASKFPPIPKGPIVLGISTDLSGPSAADGQATIASFNNVTLKQFDAEYPNGIDGHPVHLKIIDDQSTVTGSVAAANELVADHVTAAITLTSNPEGLPEQVDILNKAKIPIITPQAELPQFTDTKRYPYVFSSGASDPQEGLAAAHWFKSSGFTRIGVLTNGTEGPALGAILGATKKIDPKAKVVKAVTVSPGSVDDTAAITELKDANPQVVIVFLGFGYGPVWQAMQSSNWKPTILADAGAWYNAFSSMGDLTANAYALYNQCAPSPSTTYPAATTALMGQYSAATDAYLTNYLTFIATDTVPIDFIRYIAMKEHSVSPEAIKTGLESIHNVKFWGIDYNFSSTNHYGISGPYAAAVCHMGPPYAGGVGKIPISSGKASSVSTGAPSGLTTHSSSIGTVLAGPSGHTVYELVGATSSQSACTGSCLSIWPPVMVNGQQAVVNGHPAYTFSGDTSPGQTNGQGLTDTWGKWWALDPAGNPITTGGTTTTTGPSGY